MSTAIEIIDPALESLGVQSRILRADASMVERARKVLIGLLEDLEVEGIEIGAETAPIVLPSTAATEINNIAGTYQSLVDVLAYRMIGPARRERTSELVQKHKDGMRRLRRLFQNQTPGNIVPSRLLHKGQGSREVSRWDVFFDGEALENDTRSTS